MLKSGEKNYSKIPSKLSLSFTRKILDNHKIYSLTLQKKGVIIIRFVYYGLLY